MFRICRLAITSASLLLVAPHAVATQYSFINIADTRGPFEGVGSYNAIALSDTGTVAFIGEQGAVLGTYVGSGGAVQQVVPNLSNPPGFIGQGDLVLNESGVAARRFLCCNPEHSRIQLYDASGTRTIYEVMGGTTFFAGVSDPAINNSGAVAFGTSMRDDTPSREESLVRWFDGTSTTLVDTSDGFTSINIVAINELGDVAFQGRGGPASDPWGFFIYRTDGTTLIHIAGPFQSGNTSTAINDSGAVAFWIRLDAGGEGIFVGDGGPLTTVAIADPTTPFYEFQTDIDINNQGTVAFTARLWNGSFGIYAGGDPVNDKVVEIGDFLFGQRVSGLGQPHLNNRGDIAFSFNVLDPSVPGGEWSGIALAVKQAPITGDFNLNGTVDAADYVVWRKGVGVAPTPANYNLWRTHFGETFGNGSGATANVTVPEPATLVMLIMAAAASIPLRRRHIT